MLFVLAKLQAERFETISFVKESISEYQHGFRQNSKIPNILWTYWHDPILPDVINYCISTWRKYNPTYDIRVVNNNNIKEYINDFSPNLFKHAVDDNDRITSFARYSDYVRLNIVSKYGGLWLDASSVCQAPFDWVHGIQQAQNVDFVAYRLDAFSSKNMEHPTPVIESWFFACVPSSDFVTAWKDEFMRMSNYASVDEYLASLHDIDITGIDAPNYLAIHVANQVVLQRRPELLDTIFTISAEKSAMQYLADNNWNPHDSVTKFFKTKTYKDNPYIKFRSCERGVLEANVNDETA